ncbi:response regulator transcription factor [Pantoea sp. CTOTU49201]|uniref:response regulator transcription factor n=1 Tax=Pantoea sp. CTOTU49201 TaxID=2953855 RepID=UPI00289EA220|nr:response regulator transcription factor [Pantoea sp. CTOTU49201]
MLTGETTFIKLTARSFRADTVQRQIMSLFDHKKIRIALLDDHPITRRSLEVVAASEPDIEVVGSFGHSRELNAFLRNESVDVLVLDYILNPDELDGLSLIKQLKAHYPQLKILLASSIESIAVIRAAFMAGVKGYIGKREEAPVYFNAIRTVANGQRFMPVDISTAMAMVPTRKRDEGLLDGDEQVEGRKAPISELSNLLTQREAEVIRCFLDGMEIIEIAAKLKRSRKTISGHKQTGMKKLGLSSDLELFKYRDDLFR